MAKRKKLSVAAETKPLIKKRITLKEKLKKSEIFTPPFEKDADLYYSGFALTDNKNLVLFFADGLDKETFKSVDEFFLTENDLDISFDKNMLLEPNENYYFENIGYVRTDVFDWFRKTYANCVFHPVTKWFGKQVNTLLIVLEKKHGKPVGVVKTFT